jgi:hypothetical protein
VISRRSRSWVTGPGMRNFLRVKFTPSEEVQPCILATYLTILRKNRTVIGLLRVTQSADTKAEEVGEPS